MNWGIVFYKDENGKVPVLEYLESLPEKHAAKVMREIELLKEFGIDLKYPHTEYMEGDANKGLYELRTKLGNTKMRVFYFLFDSNKFILLHGFTKKSRKTPRKEIETARKRMEDYKRRYSKND